MRSLNRYSGSLRSRRIATLAALAGAALVSGCSYLGASGPSAGGVMSANDEAYAGSDIHILELDAATLGNLVQYGSASSFAEVFGEGEASNLMIGTGDVVEVSIWEAPPAVLFGTGAPTGRGESMSGMQRAAIPQQRIEDEGTIAIPFVGTVEAAGRTPAEIERDIIARLRGRANDPQVMVRLAQNEARTITVLGEVASSRRVALTGRGERLLDALASAGGTRQPVDKSTVQLARGNVTATMPLETIVANPDQNVRLRPGDVMTVLHQPFSFTALGATRVSAEVPFEGSGLTLAQALGRVGGLDGNRANIRGVFIFRLEDQAALGSSIPADARTTSDGRVPVIYRVNLSDPASLFAMQDFAMRDDDVLYVSTAPGADLQRFINSLSGVALTGIAIDNAVRQ